MHDHVGRKEVVAVGERFVLQPEDIEARVVAGDELVVVVRAPAAVGIVKCNCIPAWTEES